MARSSRCNRQRTRTILSLCRQRRSQSPHMALSDHKLGPLAGDCRSGADNPVMAYDDDLGERIRELVAGMDGLGEQPIFGGVAFRVNGQMAVAARGQRALLVLVDPGEGDA